MAVITHGRGLPSIVIFFLFFPGVRNNLALPCFPSFDSTGVKQSLTYHRKMALKLCRVATGRPGWKAISGEMDTHINILTGCFVIKGEKKHTKKIADDVIKRSETERKNEGREERRGNIHQINTSVALIVISPSWRSLRRARQAAKRDLSMQS